MQMRGYGREAPRKFLSYDAFQTLGKHGQRPFSVFFAGRPCLKIISRYKAHLHMHTYLDSELFKPLFSTYCLHLGVDRPNFVVC